MRKLPWFGLGGAPNGLSDKSMRTLLLIAATSPYVLLSAAPLNSDLIGPPGITTVRIAKFEITAFLAHLIWRMIKIPKGKVVGLFTTTRNAQ
jgi:hypothetical protein